MFEQVPKQSYSLLEVLMGVLVFGVIVGLVINQLYPELLNTVFDWFTSFFEENTGSIEVGFANLFSLL